jgi:hypothetical protein
MHPMLRLAASISVLLLAACATTGPATTGKVDAVTTPSSAPDPAQLGTRAVARWEHLIARRGDKAWEYLSPGYRGTHPMEPYAKAMNNRPVQWTQAEVYVPEEGEGPSVECLQPRSCTIKMKISFKVKSNLMGVGTLDSWNVLKEHWIHVQDQWYLVPEEVVR